MSIPVVLVYRVWVVSGVMCGLWVVWVVGSPAGSVWQAAHLCAGLTFLCLW